MGDDDALRIVLERLRYYLDEAEITQTQLEADDPELARALVLMNDFLASAD